ncbi:hypothetical protein DFJ58DRAFT_144820 [Suillus subalutaceus]|uniref:uncharacterized protein n=1 Tax=Suillus subalutaceus TaxID=48586 RepID=UPI001B865027|nr:uncharacterized protein DFJ58DRAFT_144820 [Suillus subalutaceus]KAG1837575.1 hypothetical protein DFJ58DRAFT_144820 [Suillus subalutaceus]
MPTIHSSSSSPTLVMSDIISYDTLNDSQRPEARKKPIPARWRPPSSFFPRLIFHTMCFCLTFHSNLDFMWEIFREPNGWENFHTLYLTQINQLSTVQGLVLTTVAVFISTPSPLKQIDYSADGPYTLLSESLVFSLFGLLLQLFTSVVGQTYQKQSTFKVLKRNRWRFLCHIIVLSIPVYIFGISLLLLIFAISVTGFLSSSTSARIFTAATFAVLSTCLFVSILPSPFFSGLRHLLRKMLWRTTDSVDDDDDDDDELDKEHSEKEAGSLV